MSEPHRRSEDELRRELIEQFEALRDFGASYDAGKEWMAKHLATTVYTLCFDGAGKSKSKSILTQLGVRDVMAFPDSRRADRENNMAEVPYLLGVQIQNHPEYVEYSYYPRFSQPSPNFTTILTNFADWWEQSVFPSKDTALTRKWLVWTMRSQDGGAHYDSMLTNEEYISMKNGKVSNVIVGYGDQLGSIPCAEASTMRAIAWEVEQAIEALMIKY